MTIRDFLLRVQALMEGRAIPLRGSPGPGGLGMKDKLPPERQDFHWRLRWSLLQLFFQDTRIHYEVWPQRQRGIIEVGLHFEGPREVNRRWAEALARRAPAIVAALGPQVELEEWTPSWYRLHETIPLGSLDEEQAQVVAQRLAAMIAALQPILEEERLAPESQTGDATRP
ncbi:MAG TPA: hypothetical protein VJ256_04085 [Dehalococcoidia bacterium]|nr:hypothetical protein [Dehalococcoidia bacterium]HLB28776.1 hypothetical protein [Dehalococcoidia bacterium]